MVKAQEVLAHILTGSLRPHYERYSLLAIPATIQGLFGLGDGLVEELGLPRTDRVVSFIVDGLGYRKLESLRETRVVDLGPFIDDGIYIPITSVFPPTTTTALASLNTGLSPIVHGILGYKLFLQEPGAVVNMIKLATPGGADNSLEKAGIKPEKLVPFPTIYQRLAENHVATTLFLPKHIMESGLSNALYQGVADTVPFFSLSDLFMLLRLALSRPGRKFLAVYWPTTDTLAHVYGPHSQAFTVEVAIFFQLLSNLFLTKVKDVVLMVTADHGFREINPRQDVIRCPELPELREGLLLPPVGDMRAAYLFVRRGHEKNVRDFFAQNFPDDFLVLTQEEALERSLWGLEKASPEMRARLGDIIAIAIGNKAIVWEKEFKLRGMHGGLTEDELLVPFLAKAL